MKKILPLSSFSQLTLHALVALLLLGRQSNCIASTNSVITASLSNAIELVFFQGGDFLMGCPTKPPRPWKPIYFDEAQPEHKVFVSPFWLGKYPISVPQFCEFLNKSRHEPTPGNRALFFKNMLKLSGGRFSPEHPNKIYPIGGVSFKDAESYCMWLSQATKRKCRLPTEAEWEYAAKGGLKNRTYPWGDAAKETRPNPWGAPLGAHPQLATPEGVFDMNGPVYQWCKDYFREDFYSVSPYADPQCTQPSGGRVSRGGYMYRVYISGERLFLPPSWKRFQAFENEDANLGFRIVAEP